MSQVSEKWQAFSAGVAFVYIVAIVIAIVAAHGTSGSPKPATWGDIAGVFVMMFLFALSAIELYEFCKE